MSKTARTLAAHAAISTLAEQFPAAFVRYGNRRPLKIGIRDDLLARGVDQAVAVIGLRWYCHGAGYLQQVKEGAARLDLDGHAAGTVTAAEAKMAADELAARKAARERPKAPAPPAAAAKRSTLKLPVKVKVKPAAKMLPKPRARAVEVIRKPARGHGVRTFNV